MLEPTEHDDRPFVVRRDELVTHLETLAAHNEKRAALQVCPKAGARWARLLRKLAGIARGEQP